MNHFAPTEQQQAFIDTSLGGAPVIVGQAGAGTGKTATIVHMARAWAAHGVGGIYITLNKVVAEEVGSKFEHGNVSAMTIHSLAYQIARATPGIAELMDKLDGVNAVRRYGIAKHMGVNCALACPEDLGDGETITIEFSPAQLCTAALRTLTRWCVSDHTHITIGHVEVPRGISDQTHTELYAPAVVALAREMWDTDITSPTGRLKFSHDYYLKMVSLIRPDMCAHFYLPEGSLLFLDEAQDARPAIIELVKAQLGRMRIVVVGDSAQAIYGFTGARDALPEFSALDGAVTLPLTQAWRFGPAVAERANMVLGHLGADIRLEGNPNVESRVTTFYGGSDTPLSDAVVVRSNRQLLEELIFELGRGRSVALMADLDQIKMVMRDIVAIKNNKPAKHPDLKDIRSYSWLEHFARPDSDEDSEILPLVRIGLDQGAGRILRMLDSCSSADSADVIITTIHKAKGREWPSVRIAAETEELVPGPAEEDYYDLRPKDPRKRLPVTDDNGTLTAESRDRFMLAYVAITRAKEELSMPFNLARAIRIFSVSNPVVPEVAAVPPL